MRNCLAKVIHKSKKLLRQRSKRRFILTQTRPLSLSFLLRILNSLWKVTSLGSRSDLDQNNKKRKVNLAIRWIDARHRLIRWMINRVWCLKGSHQLLSLNLTGLLSRTQECLGQGSNTVCLIPWAQSWPRIVKTRNSSLKTRYRSACDNLSSMKTAIPTIRQPRQLPFNKKLTNLQCQTGRQTILQ